MLARLLFNAFCRFRRILCDFISDMCVHCSVASVCSGQSISVLFAFFSSKSAGCKCKKINNQVSHGISLVVVHKYGYNKWEDVGKTVYTNLER